LPEHTSSTPQLKTARAIHSAYAMYSALFPKTKTRNSLWRKFVQDEVGVFVHSLEEVKFHKVNARQEAKRRKKGHTSAPSILPQGLLDSALMGPPGLSQAGNMSEKFYKQPCKYNSYW